MAKHNTMINGTIFQNGGGTAFVDGTTRKITKGCTFIDGTIREILFSNMVTVEITGNGSAPPYSLAQVQIDGNIYTGPATLEVEPGTRCDCFVMAFDEAHVYLNGKQVTSGNDTEKNYTFTIKTNVQIELFAGMDEEKWIESATIRITI